MTGSQIFYEMMKRNGVKHIFGRSILPVTRHHQEQFQFIFSRNGQSAGHMAEGYARVTGKPGVVLVTSRPQVTNFVISMLDALSDGVPLVVFTGQLDPAMELDSDAYQEPDIVEISRSCTKWNVMVEDIAKLPRRINEAFIIATSGRPGPVLVDLPTNFTPGFSPHTIPQCTDTHVLPTKPLIKPAADSNNLVYQAADMINHAKRPIIYAGHGILSSTKGPQLLHQLSREGNIPVTTTLHGLGAFDELDERSLHMSGMHGSTYANLAMQEADVIIALGARFDERSTGEIKLFAPAAREAAQQGKGGIIQFEIMPRNINKVINAQIPIVGDVVENLSLLVPLVNYLPRANWFTDIKNWKARYPFTYIPSSSGGLLKPQEVIQELDHQTKDLKNNVIITTGVGQHQMWAAQFYRWRYPSTMISSGGLGTMGFGLPAAIGCKIGAPDKIVINIDGDGSLCVTAMELATASQLNIGVKCMVLNNQGLDMVNQVERINHNSPSLNIQLKNPDFSKLAESMHVYALRVQDKSELFAKMKAFLEYDKSKPILMEVLVDPTENVYPMTIPVPTLPSVNFQEQITSKF
ncbi:hypothetical protein Clacol_006892 [Clathrus columnatus]|uniref:Acetolactate synthase n=1 Tax=Clathrus columnatus TaxID=1419009 RepID=A0AAV5AGL9_9AGAM|nr:hypothetical protein Clacol_006892 [Clathrus columnatus]